MGTIDQCCWQYTILLETVQFRDAGGLSRELSSNQLFQDLSQQGFFLHHHPARLGMLLVLHKQDKTFVTGDAPGSAQTR